MTARPKAILVGVLVGAALGAITALMAAPDEEAADGGETGLAALGPGEYIQLGIGFLAFARQFGALLKRI